MKQSIIAALMAIIIMPGILAAGEVERAERASATVDAVLAGDGDAASAHFNDTLRAALPAAQITGIVDALRQQVGEPGGRGPLRHGCEAGHHTVWQRIDFARAQLAAKLVFDDEDRIGGLFFVPPQSATPCAAESGAQTGENGAAAESGRDPREREASVGAADWPLPGLLTLPDGEGPFPAVVLVHGSGPHDADETIFASKPFRDIAHGLADRGVASLRYVKRSKQHGARMMTQTPGFGIDEEVTDDAVAGMDWLAAQDAVDASRLHVLGHSLGAMLAPRICQRSRQCAGMIVLAGPTRPVDELVLEQIRYLAPHQDISDEQIAALEAQAAQVARLRAGDEVEGPLLLGLSADYWRSLVDYDPVASARAAARPMLILQGERDYQVTMADLAGWRDGLSGIADIRLRSYPALDHLFMAGSGASLPADYMQPRNVDMQVIDDIAAWIKDRLGRTTGETAR